MVVGRRSARSSAASLEPVPDMPTRMNRRMTTVAAGHKDGVLKDWRETSDTTNIPDYVIKEYDEQEVAAYERLQADRDPVRQFTPCFYGEVLQDHLEQELAGKRYIRLSNLLKGFKRGPNVMDCKLGVRSFSEAEASITKPRPDLYERMVALDPTAPTTEENESKAITKYRWMTFNDALTHLPANGFRIDGIVCSTAGEAVPKSVLKKLQNLPDMAECIKDYFLPCPETREDEDEVDEEAEELKLQQSIVDAILQRLRELEQVFLTSPFVQKHSFVGSSILIVADEHGPGANVFLIDLAKTTTLPEGVAISHDSPWVPGNNEDGILIGVRNLIKCWEIVASTLAPVAR